jgi:ferrous iron transport protein A
LKKKRERVEFQNYFEPFGRITLLNPIILDKINKEMTVEVIEIHGGWGTRQRLNQMGIHPGDRLLIKRSGFMGGPMLVQVHGMDVALGRGMAQKVLVKEME